MELLLSLLSFLVGGILLFLTFASTFDLNKDFKSNFFFLAILTSAGLQRVIFFLDDFGFIGNFTNPLTKSLVFAYLIPPLFYFFFRGLLLVSTSIKTLIIHVSVSISILILTKVFELAKDINQILFLIYSSAYYLSLIVSCHHFLKKRKNQVDLQHFKRIRNWGILMFTSFTLTYFFSNFYYGRGLESTQQDVLRSFYGATSFLWLVIAFYLIKNPLILFGELRLIEQIIPTLYEEISIWKTKKKVQTSSVDLGVEKQLSGRVEELIFALKKLEQGWAEELVDVPSIKSLAFQLDCPQSHLKYLFKYYSNYSFGEYVNVLKVNYAISLIRRGYLAKHTVNSLSKQVLFQSVNTFYLNFKKLTGGSPSDFHAQLETSIRI